jgi:hypothetical protein
MQKKIRMAVGLVAVSLAAGMLLYFLLPVLNPPQPGVTPENFRRLHKGMSQEEVEAILGSPGQDVGRMTLQKMKEWQAPDCFVYIVFSEIRGGGAEYGFVAADDRYRLELAEEPPEAPFVKRFSRWFGLQR